MVSKPTIPILLEAIYERGDKKELIEYLEFCQNIASKEPKIAALTDFVCSQNELLNPYKLSPQSLKLLYKCNLPENLIERIAENIKDPYLFKFVKDNIDKPIKNIKNNDINIGLLNFFEDILGEYILKHNDSGIDLIEEWPKEFAVKISKMYLDEKIKIKYKPWLRCILNKSHKKLKLKFDYLINDLTIKNKRKREEIINLDNNQLVIFPSCLSPMALSNDKDHEFYDIEIV